MIQIVQDDQCNGEQYNFYIGQCIYCWLCEEVCFVDVILFMQNFEFMVDMKNDFVYNKEQFKNVLWYKDIDLFNFCNFDCNVWVGEGEGEVDYQ